jgi:hypothetical protein
MALIDYIDGDTRRIYLSVDTMNTSWHPVDLYREVRSLRKTDESLRKYDNFMRGDGNIDKGGGKATERYFTLLDGARVVPYDASHILDITGTLITDDGFEGAFCFDKTPLTAGVAVDIQYAPKQVEVINLNFDDLVYSSFQGSVWVDITSEWSDAGSSNFPNGNRERPVNNVSTAISIANERGFDTISVLGNLTITTGDDVSGFNIKGSSPITSVITVDSGAECYKAAFRNCSLTGVLDGLSYVEECLVTNLTYFNGVIRNSSIQGTIWLSGGVDARLDNCSIFSFDNPPVVDMGGSGQSLIATGYSGYLTITNYADAVNQIGIGMFSGQVNVDSTCTDGMIFINGVCTVDDQSGAGCSVVTSGVVTTHSDGLSTKSDVYGAALL